MAKLEHTVSIYISRFIIIKIGTYLLYYEPFWLIISVLLIFKLIIAESYANSHEKQIQFDIFKSKG